MQNLKIYIIAGEASGDILGAKLMSALRNQSTAYMDFYGIGGDRMIGHGLHSLFPMSDISIMGFAEIVPHIPRVLKRINQTVQDILRVRPDVVVTIDSPGFCCRVAKKLRGSGIKLVHYVAPTVWAYKPKRAEKFAKLFDHMLLLLPFEKPYFDKVGMETTYVGHPIIEDAHNNGDAKKFKDKHRIAASEKILAIMPGSRRGEIKRMMPVYSAALDIITHNDVSVRPVILTIPFLKPAIQKYGIHFPDNTIIVDSPTEKNNVFAASNAAMAKSGTGTLELSLAGVPLNISYKINIISYWLIKFLIKVKYANLLNLVMDKEIIPEFLQNKCKPKLLADSALKLLQGGDEAKIQVREAQDALTKLGLSEDSTPSGKAAKVIIDIIKKVRASKKPYQV